MQTAQHQPIRSPLITWEPLPEDYILPDDPVDHQSQPLLAAALRESLELADLITPTMLVATNFGICATVEGKTVVKAPDWVYVPQTQPLLENQTRRSYTPHLEGAPPTVVIEFISETDGGEYSMNPNYPYGKWWFYERILQVPVYLIFQPETGVLECYRRVRDRYESQFLDATGHYWLDALNLAIGVWHGTKADRTGYWLRWWTSDEECLPWGRERLKQEQKRADQAQQKAQQAEQRAEAFAAQLRALGIETDLDAGYPPEDG